MAESFLSGFLESRLLTFIMAHGDGTGIVCGMFGMIFQYRVSLRTSDGDLGGSTEHGGRPAD